MAQKKGSGSSKNGRDSSGRRLGVKCSDGQIVNPGSIVVRQRGTKFFPAVNVSIGKDHTIFATIPGKVKFFEFKRKKMISVEPID